MIEIRDINNNLIIDENKKIGIGVAEKLIVVFQENKLQHFELPVTFSGFINYRVTDFQSFKHLLSILKEKTDVEII